MGKRGPSVGPLRSKALELRLAGLSYAEIGRALGISRQRVMQITKPPPLVRSAVVARDGGACQSCGVFLGKSGHVHHTLARGLQAEDYNDLPNLQLLCPTCHRLAHTPGNGCAYYLGPERCPADDGSYHCAVHSKTLAIYPDVRAVCPPAPPRLSEQALIELAIDPPPEQSLTVISRASKRDGNKL